MLNFIHLTDSHFLDDTSNSTKEINPFNSFLNVIEHIKKTQTEYQFILITGDISQSGSKKSYQRFIQLLARLKKPYYCLPGNHDDAALLKALIANSPDKQISINQIAAHQLILLNSQNMGSQGGIISTENLLALKTTLDNSTQPTIIALHHPPVSIQSSWMDKINLANKEKLLAILEKYPQVKLVLFGHVHQAIDKKHKHIRLLATPSTSYQFTPKTQTMHLDQLAPGYRTIQLQGDDQINTQVIRVENV